jgi:hypothetical protein
MLQSELTIDLKAKFARSELDLILTTEPQLDPGGETLAQQPLVWVGAVNGQIWKARPLRFGSTNRCLFRRSAIEALDQADLPWELAVESISCSSVEVSVIADLAVFVQLAGSIPAHCEEIRHGGALPELPEYRVNMYVGEGPRLDLAERLAGFIRQAYGCGLRVVAAE